MEDAVVTINGQTWQVSLATLPWELSQGLSGISSIPTNTGMLFDIWYQQTIDVTTENMLFPIDIAFISSNFTITDIYREVAPGYIITSEHLARYFLEVNAGELSGINVGDTIIIETLGIPVVSQFEWMDELFNLFMQIFPFIIFGVFTIGIVKMISGSNPGNPGHYPTNIIPEPYQREIRIELRKIPTWKLKEVHSKLKAGETTGIGIVEQNRVQAISAVEEILYERGKMMSGSNPGKGGIEAFKQKLDDQISNENIAYMDYKAMADEAERLDLSVFAKDLRRISNQEYSHSETLKGIRRDLATMEKLGYSGSGSSIPLNWYEKLFTETIDGKEFYRVKNYYPVGWPDNPRIEMSESSIAKDTYGNWHERARGLTFERWKVEVWKEAGKPITYGHSIHGEPRIRLVKKYGTWAVGRAEAVCPEDDVACVEREAKRLYETLEARHRGEGVKYIKITNPGKTIFHLGDVISSVAFEKENARVRIIGEREAVGEDVGYYGVA